jgi:hypothetical protein
MSTTRGGPGLPGITRDGGERLATSRSSPVSVDVANDWVKGAGNRQAPLRRAGSKSQGTWQDGPGLGLLSQ